ncbi:MAG: hypothetical protein CVU57_11520 [Deltaproteobacteria bacterium HGW-Deltaproteobacteria-15]|jgi:nitrogen-specific signal transduction histidine kinase|nr:MAG: hypothetical protein CVU57_11520 [Deltaproteobacteria bacterium HGW-Deltaproteobacteria-15]
MSRKIDRLRSRAWHPGRGRKKVFFPFFSKKKEGTGLGLTIAKKVVIAHGGTISFYRNPGGGVTF